MVDSLAGLYELVDHRSCSSVSFNFSDFRSGNVTIFQVSGAIAATPEGAAARNLLLQCIPAAAANAQQHVPSYRCCISNELPLVTDASAVNEL